MRFSAWKHTSPEQRVLMLSSGLMVIGFYSLIPRLTLHLTSSYHWTLGVAGLVLAIRQIAQQGLSVWGGAIVDRAGPKLGFLWGVGLRALGFLGFAFADSLFEFSLAAALSGLGGALFDPADKKAFAASLNGAHAEQLFALRKVSDNLAFALSALVGLAITAVPFQTVGLVSAAMYAAVMGLAAALLPAYPSRAVEKAWEGVREVFRDRQFLWYTAVLSGYYYLACQLYATVPVLLQEQGVPASYLYGVYVVLALTVVMLQMPLARRMALRENRFSLIGLGALLMAVGLVALETGRGLLPIAFFVACFGAGLMLAAPVLLEVVPLFAPKNRLGAYYGFNNYAVGVGGALSSLLAGWCLDLRELASLQYLFAVSTLVIGALVFLGLTRLGARRASLANGSGGKRSPLLLSGESHELGAVSCRSASG